MKGAFFAVLAALAVATSAAYAPDRVRSLPSYGPLTSANYAGYIPDGQGRKAFYWFVESQRSPSTDPIVLWLNGGPGCSSILGKLEENGPYVMRHGGKWEDNQFAWNKIANVLYFESPAGVGFSVDTMPPTQWNDNKTVKYNYAVLRGFFQKFPELKGRKLILTGESYAGFYVPELAHEILVGPDADLQAQMRGFMVGNPCTGRIGCENADPTLEPYLAYNGFHSFRKDSRTENANYNRYDLLVPTCDSQAVANRIRFNHPITNAYKSKMARAGKFGNPPAPYGPCADNYVSAWLDRADVRAALHIEDGAPHWSACASISYEANTVGVVDLYKTMMARTNWDIMIYSGLDDSIVNQAQTQAIINNEINPAITSNFAGWYHPYSYNASQRQLGGFFQLYDRMSWAGVRDAGHMVPQFNPPAGFELFRSFMETGKPGRMHE